MTTTIALKGPYAPVPYCGDHRTYRTGCDHCRRYSTWRNRLRTRRLQNGERLTVPIAEVRAHLDKLTSRGMTPKQIQAATGLHRSTVASVLYRRTRKVVGGHIAQKLLAIPVPAEPAGPPPLAHVTDPTGTLRRIQALARIGWTYRHIAAAGQTSHRLEHLAGQKWVTHEVAAAIARAYDLLSMTPGPSTRTASRAERTGWVPPLAWDEDTIDDPDAKPDLGEAADGGGGFDEITVQQAVDGQLTHTQLAAHRPDLIETIRRLAAAGMADRDIAHHLHWPGASTSVGGRDRKSLGQTAVCQIRKRHGIPAPAPERLPMEHSSTRLRRARRADRQHLAA